MAKKKSGKKMIKMLTSMSGHDFNYVASQIIEVEEHIAEAWIKADIAEYVEGDE
jgi:hypothetical protein